MSFFLKFISQISASSIPHPTQSELWHRSGDLKIETVVCKYLIGCDGAHSFIRSELFLPFKEIGIEQTYILGT